MALYLYLPLFDFYIVLASFLEYSRNNHVCCLGNVSLVWIDCTNVSATHKKSGVFDCNFPRLGPYKSF